MGRGLLAFIWFIGAATSVQSHRGYLPGRADRSDQAEFAVRMRRLRSRSDSGEVIDPSDFPSDYRANPTDPNRNLVLPVWQSGLVHVRIDVVEVLRQFDMGKTVLVPIRVALPDDAGVRTDFFTISVPNLKPTIDPAQSEPLERGLSRRLALSSAKPVHPGVVAYPSALSGPDIWVDPDVMKTIFVSDRLALALKALPDSPKLGLKKVRVAPSPEQAS